MAYFKLNGTDYSMYVSGLKVMKKHIYKSAINASGNTVAKLINTKSVIEVDIIPLDDEVMRTFYKDINSFQVSFSYRNPETGELLENVKGMIPTSSIDYYTIQANNVKYQKFTIKIEEL